MCTIFHNWERPTSKLPPPNQRVLVVVKMKYGGNLWTTIAEHVPKHTVRAEDFVDPDCDPDFCDIGDDGEEYTPDGWYESTIESEYLLRLDGEVKYWAYLPVKPRCQCRPPGGGVMEGCGSFNELFARLEQDPEYIKESLKVAREINTAVMAKYDRLIERLENEIASTITGGITRYGSAILLAESIQKIIDEVR